MAEGFGNLSGMRCAALAVMLGVLAAACGQAQYPGQLAKPEKQPVLRAISVLEWTGEERHPKASRLVPVMIFDSGAMADGGIYLARPEPLSLEREVEYELQRNGRPIGLYEIKNAGQEQGAWVGYGAWKAAIAPTKPRPATALPLNPSWDDVEDRPVLHRKHHADDAPAGASGKKPAAEDEGRPTLHRKTEDTGAAQASADDPDRPVLHKKPASDSTAADEDADRPTLHKKNEESAGASQQPAAEADPDRPTLRRKKSEDAGQTKKKRKQEEVGFVEALANASDPDRPRLKRGKSAGVVLDVLPSLMGLPPDLQQAVAVSDARTMTQHEWSFAWSDPADEAKMRAALEDAARVALGVAPPPLPALASAARKKSKKLAAPLAVAAPALEPATLADEDFRVFELSYGAGATLVLSAHTENVGAVVKYATLVAQPDLYGHLRVLLKSVTDTAHMDQSPRMRLVDAVDALADNRGELLFEMRGQSQRQFALYRVDRGQIEQIFATAPADLALAPRAAE